MSSKQTVTTEEVERIAALARLRLTKGEIETAAKDLSNVLQNFSSIQSIDTSTTPTADDVSGLKNVVRTDEATAETLASHEELLNLAPQTQDRQVRVKAIFE